MEGRCQRGRPDTAQDPPWACKIPLHKVCSSCTDVPRTGCLCHMGYTAGGLARWSISDTCLDKSRGDSAQSAGFSLGYEYSRRSQSPRHCHSPSLPESSQATAGGRPTMAMSLNGFSYSPDLPKRHHDVNKSRSKQESKICTDLADTSRRRPCPDQ
jgi:hypothetical protein